MCRSALHPFIAALPKCEHHMHLEGSLSPTLLFQLAAQNSITLPSTSTDPAFASPAALYARYQHFTSLDDFLHYYFIAMSVLRTAADFEALAYAYFTRAHADAVAHAELFFDPQAHTARGVPYAAVVEGLSRAQQRAEQDYGLSSRLILCFLRHLPASSADTAFADADALGHFSDGTLAAIGLDSSEVGFPPELFRDVYAAAAAKGINRTAHAGEEGDASYISRALDLCHVQRIDHGIRLVDDAALLARVAAAKTLVTVCPLSNVRLRCVPAISDLPIRRFLDAGVHFSINSDDPAYFGGYILDNYCAVQEAFELSVEEWVGVARNSVGGSWCGEVRRGVILEKIAEVAERFRGVEA